MLVDHVDGNGNVVIKSDSVMLNDKNGTKKKKYGQDPSSYPNSIEMK